MQSNLHAISNYELKIAEFVCTQCVCFGLDFNARYVIICMLDGGRHVRHQRGKAGGRQLLDPEACGAQGQLERADCKVTGAPTIQLQMRPSAEEDPHLLPSPIMWWPKQCCSAKFSDISPYMEQGYLESISFFSFFFFFTTLLSYPLEIWVAFPSER